MNLDEIRSEKVKVLLRFAVPSIIAMVMTSMITIVDGFFTGNYVGKEGVAAVNLGLPIVYLFLALGLMLSVGGVAIAGMLLGAGKYKECNNVFNQTMLTTLVASVVTSLIVFLCFEPMLKVLQAKGEVATYFTDYYHIMLFQFPIMVVNSSLGMFIRGEGNPQYFMKVNVINVVLNIVLDYLFARWLNLGISGIAMASLLSGVVALMGSVYFFLKKAKIYSLARFTFDKEVLKNTLLNGSSEFIGEMSMCVSMFAFNFVIMRNVGVSGVTAFTIVGYSSYLFSMIIVGFGQGASPLLSFTYGAKEWKLTRSIRKTTNQFVFGAGVFFVLLLSVGAGWYSEVFVKNADVQKMVHTGIYIFMISFLFSGINTIASFYFTSIGKAKESAIISSARGLVILLICIFTLPALFGMTGVWMVSPITEGLTLLISLTFIFAEKKREVQNERKYCDNRV